MYTSKNKGGVYRIKSGNSIYYGRTICLRRRYKTHRRLLANNKHFNRQLQSSYNIHKEISFTVLKLTDNLEEQIRLEQNYIDNYDNCNVTDSSNGGNTREGRVNSKEHRQKISKSLTGRNLSLEHKKSISDSHLGKKASSTTKDKMSNTRRGMPSGRRDKKVYNWYNREKGITDIGTRAYMQAKYDLERYETFRIVKQNKEVKGWTL